MENLCKPGVSTRKQEARILFLEELDIGKTRPDFHYGYSTP